MKKLKKYLISPIIVSIIILMIYAIKGIAPFGKNTIANGDMGQAYMPFYYLLFDIIRNGKNIFFNYNLGMGSNVYGGFVVDGLFNPSVLVILLNTRENIPYMFSLVMLIKIVFISITSFVLFNKLDKENVFYNVIFSVLYALSGYVLSYNTNIMWLDVVGLFPLFILSIKYMFETNKIYWYAIILSLTLIFNYNLAYMILCFIIFVIPIYIRFGLEKEERKKAVFNVIIGTILSVGLSAFAFIPAFMQTMSSYRMSGVVTNSVTNENVLYKIVVFIFYSLPVYGYINWFKHYKEDEKAFKIINLSLLFSAILPIIFERINLLWHTGSYQEFPFRYGFIPTLLLYIGALRYFCKFEKNEEKSEYRWKIYREITISLIAFMIIIGIYTAKIINISFPAFSMNIAFFVLILTLCVLGYMAFFGIFSITENKKKIVAISIVTIIQLLTYTYAYLGVIPEYRGDSIEWSDEQIFLSNTINSKLKKYKNTLYRIKDLTGSTTENCSLVYDEPSFSTFLHIISKEQVLNYEQLGYSMKKTKLNDCGGTLISDAIYGVKYIMTDKEMPEQLYTFCENITDDISLYEVKDTLPIGVLTQNEVIDIPQEIQRFDAQNYLYQKIFNKNDDIIQVTKNIDFDRVSDNDTIYKYIVNVEEDSELYIDSSQQLEYIKINNENIDIPTLNNNENLIYPNGYYNGILDLGYFEKDSSVEIEIKTVDNELENDKVQIGTLNISKYKECINENQNDINIQVDKNKIRIDGTVDDNSILFIPVNYDAGWKCINSNKEVKRIYNTFIGINLDKGNNEIDLEFIPDYFIVSMKITIATIIFMIFMYFCGKKFDIRNIKFLMILFWIIGIIIYIFAIYKFYIVCIFKTFFS